MNREHGLTLAALITVGLGGCAAVREHAPLEQGRAAPPPATEAAPAATPATPAKAARVIASKPSKCVPDDLGAPPAYPDTDAALRDAGGAADRYQLIAAGRLLRQQRLQKLEETVKRCRSLGR